MKHAAIAAAVALAFVGAAQAKPRFDAPDPQWMGAPPSQPLASPGLYQSGNECAPDRAEPEWDRNYKFLGYACVRPGPGGR